MKKLFIVGLLLAAPMVAGAAHVIYTVGGFIGRIISVINHALVPLVLALAFIVFIWGVSRYFIFDTEEAKEKGKDLMLWGFVGFFVIISVWGIVNLLLNTFWLDNRAPTELPRVLQGSGSRSSGGGDWFGGTSGSGSSGGGVTASPWIDPDGPINEDIDEKGAESLISP